MLRTATGKLKILERPDAPQAPDEIEERVWGAPTFLGRKLTEVRSYRLVTHEGNLAFYEEYVPSVTDATGTSD